MEFNNSPSVHCTQAQGGYPVLHETQALVRQQADSGVGVLSAAIPAIPMTRSRFVDGETEECSSTAM